MKPLNQSERKKAFTNFILLFCLTIFLVVGAVYFGMQMPFKQNEQLQQRIAFYERENFFSQNFYGKVNETKSMLDSVNRAEVRADFLDGKVTENLKKMNAMIDKDSLSVKGLYELMVLSLSDLQMAKKGLRNASGKDDNLGQMQATIIDLRGQLQTAQADATNWHNAYNQLSLQRR